MGGTILEEEEPVPDTLSDPPPVPAAAGAVAPARFGRRRAILVAAAALGAALLVAAVGLYLFVIRYEPVARRHIPGNATFAARVEFTKVILFGPVRDHLWPLVTGPRADEASDQPTRLEKIHDATGVDLAKDGRELVLASVDGTSWVAALGGRFERGRFVKGLAKVARAEAWQGFHLEGELLLGPGGVAIGQADDGTIVVGSNAAITTAALPASDEYKRLDLADDAAVTFSVTHEAWGGATGLLGMAMDHTPALGRVERATGKLTLGSAPELTLRIETKLGQRAAEVAGDLQTTVNELRILTLLTPDFFGEKGALGGVRIAANADGASVAVTTPWPYEGLDRGCAKLASTLRALGAGR